jgi:hypothetical protein
MILHVIRDLLATQLAALGESVYTSDDPESANATVVRILVGARRLKQHRRPTTIILSQAEAIVGPPTRTVTPHVASGVASRIYAERTQVIVLDVFTPAADLEYQTQLIDNIQVALRLGGLLSNTVGDGTVSEAYWSEAEANGGWFDDSERVTLTFSCASGVARQSPATANTPILPSPDHAESITVEEVEVTQT